MSTRASNTARPIRMRASVVMKLVAMIALGSIAAGCGSEGEAAMVTIGGTERQLVTIEPAPGDTQLEQYNSPAMGGVRFSVDPAHHLYVTGDTIVVSISDPAGEAAWETASIGLVTQTVDGIPIDSVDQVLDLIAGAPAEVTSTGTAIEVMGHHLAGYEVRGDASTKDLWIIAADRIGGPPFSLFGYTPNARIFIGETPAGVLVAASSEADEVSNLDAIDVALGTLVANIEATGDGLDAPLPPAQSLEPDETQDSMARGELDPNGATPLDAPFSPIEPGTYQLANFGPTFTLEFTEAMFVQPNFPGFIVLTGLGSGGPGDRDVVMVTGMVDVLAIAPGPIPAGQPAPVTSATDVIDALSANFEITGIEMVDLDGLAATRFDLRTPADASCTEADPCEAAFRTSWGFVKPLSSTQTHRIWWIEEGAEGPSMIIAMAPRGHDFIAKATQLIDTMTFN